MPSDKHSLANLSRRAVLAASGTAILAATTAAAEQRSGPPAHEKGPRVFLDYDQTELDAAYLQSAYEPNLDQVHKRWISNSDLARTRIGEPQRIAYGPKDIERLDVYRTRAANAPVFIFIHGGAWRAGSARAYGAIAETFINAGAHCVLPDFSWVQDTGGDLMPIADQVRRAVAHVYRNADNIGADRNRIYVAGQSSGGHLAGVVLTTDWEKAYQLPATLIKGGMCISGMYDLAPVRLSARSSYVKFTDEMVEALSSQRHIDQLHAPLIVAYGSYETPEFQRQNREFAAAIKNAGKPVRLIVAENYSHLELPETLQNPYGILGLAALEQMGLTAKT
jgi:arylformamidase